MAKPKVKSLPPEDRFEAKLRAFWADYRPVFPDETFAEFIKTAPLINCPEDDALCAAFSLLPDDTRAAITKRIERTRRCSRDLLSRPFVGDRG